MEQANENISNDIEQQTSPSGDGQENAKANETGLISDSDVADSTDPSFNENAVIPDCLDDEIYDKETREFKREEIIKRLQDNQDEINKFRKQANDMRRKLSKGANPLDSVEEYADGYQYDSKYDVALSDDESEVSKHIKSTLSRLDKFAYEHALSKETAKDLKNEFMEYAESVKILDTRTDAEREKAHTEYILEQKRMLGEDAERIIHENVKFVNNYNIFSEDEKKMLLSGMDKSAVVNGFVHKLKTLFDNGTSSDIPMRDVVVSGLADDRALAREYYDSKTPDSRRLEILQQRRDAGRVGGLPSPF